MAYAAYKHYKDSGIKTIGLMPQHWAVRRLKFMARIQNGKDYKEVASDEGFPVIGSGGEFAKANTYLYDGESVLLGRKGTIDRPRYINGPFWTVDTMFYTEVAPDVSAKYFYYCATTINFLEYATSTALPSMTQQDLGAIPFAVPASDEQQTIARFLDFKTAQIDALIAKKQTLLDKLAEKRTALIGHAVTKGLDPQVKMQDSGVAWLGEIPAHWKISALKRHWSVTDCKHVTAEFVAEGYPLASIREVQSRWVKLEDAKRTTEYFYQLLIEGDRKPQPGDLIFSRNATVGEVAQVHADHPPFAMGQDVVLLRKLLPDFSSDFLQLLIRSVVVTDQLALSMIGSTFKRINVEEIRSLVVPFPPSGEQHKICQHLESFLLKMDEQTTKVKAAVKSLLEYRAALVTNAVTGKIDVRSFEIPQPAEEVAS